MAATTTAAARPARPASPLKLDDVVKKGHKRGDAARNNTQVAVISAAVKANGGGTKDGGGYNAAISAAFWTSFSQKLPSVSAHPDTVPVLARELASNKRKRSFYMSGGVWGNGVEEGPAAGGGAFLPAGTVPWPADSTDPVSLLGEDSRAGFEKWLTRKRLHYCETHSSDG